jgi:hypothetical protein
VERLTLPLSRPRSTSRAALAAVAWLFVGCLVIQFFLVGLNAFEADPWELHRDFAYLYGWLAPALVLLAGLARAERHVFLLAVAVLVAFGIQTYLPTIADRLPELASIHAVNALAIVWLAVRLARGASRVPEPGRTTDR